MMRKVHAGFIGIREDARDAFGLHQLTLQYGALALVLPRLPAREGRAEGRGFRESGLRPSQVIRTGDPPLEIRLGLSNGLLLLRVVGDIANERVARSFLPLDWNELHPRRQGAHVVRSVGRDEGAETRLDFDGGLVVVVGGLATGRGAGLDEEELDGIFGLGGAGEEWVARGVVGGGGCAGGTLGGGAFGFLGGFAEEVS
mmetsp:Transcript_15483/g.32795  ORF Transcript_15483/g.32795 Transcript_15483/m.32795 type:complete len:200 (-) Transcript_15483:178-777(-)